MDADDDRKRQAADVRAVIVSLRRGLAPMAALCTARPWTRLAERDGLAHSIVEIRWAG
jgi:hypothetical protein